MTPAATPEALVAMTKAEQAEDEAFALAYTTARGAVDYEHMARVLSGRLRRMNRRAAAANRRADTAEAALATATAEAASLRTEVEALKEDAARLDFLDGCNARLNASYGTHYGWKLVLNHNVNRLMLGDMEVDLHDSEGGNDKLPSCRLAIDEARKRTALARAATAGEG
jgi:hypothetical protein